MLNTRLSLSRSNLFRREEHGESTESIFCMAVTMNFASLTMVFVNYTAVFANEKISFIADTMFFVTQKMVAPSTR